MIDSTHSIKVAVYYNQEFHNSLDSKYIPNPNWNEYTNLLLKVLERSSINSESRIADIGAGAGKYSLLLSPYVKEILAVEPNDYLRDKFIKLTNKLNVKNIKIVNDHMPECIANIDTDTVLLIESIYLTENWYKTFLELINNTHIQNIIIADGPDDESNPIDNSKWHTPFSLKNTRLPLLSGDEYKMIQEAVNYGWSVKLFDVSKNIEINDEFVSDWVLIAKRNK